MIGKAKKRRDQSMGENYNKWHRETIVRWEEAKKESRGREKVAENGEREHTETNAKRKDGETLAPRGKSEWVIDDQSHPNIHRSFIPSLFLTHPLPITVPLAPLRWSVIGPFVLILPLPVFRRRSDELPGTAARQPLLSVLGLPLLVVPIGGPSQKILRIPMLIVRGGGGK